jgi:hypothetical protein
LPQANAELTRKLFNRQTQFARRLRLSSLPSKSPRNTNPRQKKRFRRRGRPQNHSFSDNDSVFCQKQLTLSWADTPTRLNVHANFVRGTSAAGALFHSGCRPDRASAKISLLVYSRILPVVIPRASRVNLMSNSESKFEI